MKTLPIIIAAALTSIALSGCTTDYSNRHGSGYESHYDDSFDEDRMWDNPFYDYWMFGWPQDFHHHMDHHGHF